VDVATAASDTLHQPAGLLAVELDWQDSLRCHCCHRIMIVVGTCEEDCYWLRRRHFWQFRS
jgi:hypothetical protein